MNKIIEELLLDVKLKLGDPIRKSPLEDADIKRLLKMCIEDSFLYSDHKKTEKVSDDTFTTLNNKQKTAVRNLLVAECKILMGIIYSRLSGNVTDNVVIDYKPLLDQGYMEKHLAIEQLSNN